jgi:hypothetical protein
MPLLLLHSVSQECTLVRRVCISSETDTLSLGCLAMSAGVPVTGAGWGPLRLRAERA